MRHDHQISGSQLAEMIYSAGIRPSLQRIAVFNLVANSKKHPTADDIYSELSDTYPSLSRTTVYNSLHTLVTAGLIKELEVECGNKHYDFARQPAHSHFVCRRCGKFFDMPLPEDIEKLADKHFLVDSVDLCFKGLCPDCVNNNK